MCKYSLFTCLSKYNYFLKCASVITFCKLNIYLSPTVQTLYRGDQQSFFVHLDPLAAGAVHIRFSNFLLAHYISAFKHVKDKKLQ